MFIFKDQNFNREFTVYFLDINILNGNGENVLHVAAQSHKVWQENGNDQQQESNRYRSYESQKLEENIPSIVKILIERHWYETSIYINHEDEEGRTPLHLAVMANRYSFVSYLLKTGARIDVKNFFIFHLSILFSFSKRLQLR